MNLTNQLLIATPDMQDERFYRAVILICEHNEHGALGININLPSDVQFDEILESLQINENPFSELNQLIYEGGPVNTQCGFILHQPGKPGELEFESSIQVSDSINLTTSKDIIRSIANNHFNLDWLMALGCATWDAGQLEQEVADHAWLITAVNDDLVFNHQTDRWDKALALMGVQAHQLSSDIGHA